MTKRKTIYLPGVPLTEGNYFTMNVNGDRPFSEMFDFNMLSISSNCRPTNIELFVNEIFPKLNLPKSKIELRKKAVNNIISNLLYCNANGKYLAINKRKCNYNNSSFYGLEHFTYAYIVNAVNKLVKYGFVDEHPGFYSRDGGRSFLTRINANNKLLTLAKSIYTKNFKSTIVPFYCSDVNKNVFIQNESVKNNRLKIPIILNIGIEGKGKKKQRIPYQLNKDIKQKIAFLNKYLV